MLHWLFEPGKPWFRPKRFGYGAGLPIAWQGWVLMASYIAALLGLSLIATSARGSALAGAIALMAVLTVLFAALVRARTEGEWRWRWGEDE